MGAIAARQLSILAQSSSGLRFKVMLRISIVLRLTIISVFIGCCCLMMGHLRLAVLSLRSIRLRT